MRWWQQQPKERHPSNDERARRFEKELRLGKRLIWNFSFLSLNKFKLNLDKFKLFKNFRNIFFIELKFN